MARVRAHIYVSPPGAVPPAIVGTGANRAMLAVEGERRWLFGPIEGGWWRHHAWWVIPVGAMLLVMPWIIMARLQGWWPFGPPPTPPAASAPASLPTSSPPGTAPPPAAGPKIRIRVVPRSGGPHEPTDEELNRRFRRELLQDPPLGGSGS